MSDTIISVENLAKRYVISHQTGSGEGLRHRIEDLARAPLRWLRSSLKGGQDQPAVSPASEEFWALKDVSFEIKRGDVVGIIGRNGAGKSTLLKILSRIVEPTSGRIVIDGRVASLLEVGTGFHPELTGRENIYLNGAILGMSRVEIKKKFDEIVAFAETEQFLDTPVKRYSSGMYVRLAFAVAAHLEPEILIVDEVLAVGDAQFQKKCLGKMQDVANQSGRTVLFVSHNIQAVSALCSRSLLLEKGRLKMAGLTGEVVAAYMAGTTQSGTGAFWRGAAGDENLTVSSIRLIGTNAEFLTTNQPIQVEVCAQIHRPIYGLVVAFEVRSTYEQLLAYTAQDDALSPPPETVQPGSYKWILTIPADTFAAGSYEFRLDMGIHNIKRIIGPEEIRLKAVIENTAGIGRRFQSHWSHTLRPAWHWETHREADNNLRSSVACNVTHTPAQ